MIAIYLILILNMNSNLLHVSISFKIQYKLWIYKIIHLNFAKVRYKSLNKQIKYISHLIIYELFI